MSSDFPSVTYPWLAARDRLGMHIRWVRDTPARDLTLSLGDAISDRTTVVCVSPVQFATGSRSMSRPWWRAPETLAPGWWPT